MGLLSLLESLINEHGSSTILRERLGLVKDQLGTIMKKMADLEEECADLRKKTAEMSRELEERRSKETFTEHRGALFKRKGPDGYHEVPYCPICRTAMGFLVNVAPFHCKPCRQKSSFPAGDLPKVMDELSRDC